MRKGILLAMGGLLFLAGCGGQGTKAPGDEAKWKGAPYRITLDTREQKPNPAGITIPVIDYTADPEALERRATLVVRFDAAGAKRSQAAEDQAATDQMIMAPTDISGAAGALPASYMDSADRGLAKLLAAYCMKGKVKISVALVRSSVKPQAGDAELNDKRLSDWLPIELEFKNPHPKC
ncbi:MAG TPA: hypothetical protein VLZ50_09575 [Terracidiphilus sp.]|nr:hypothetical protein [Terracidiphilus sp.]